MDTHYELRLKKSTSVEDVPYEPDGYVEGMRAEIVRFGDEDDDDGKVVGEIEAELIRMPTSIDEWNKLECSVFDVFDAHSAELCDLYPILFTSKGALRKNIDIEHMEFPFAGILHLRSLTLDPEERRRGLGLKVVWTFVQRWFSHVSMVVLQACPLPDAKLSDEENKLARQEGAPKLAKYWARLGFTALTGQWMYFDPCRKMPNPFTKGLRAA